MLLNQMNPHGGDIYHNDVIVDFSTNVNPWGVHPHILEAMKKALEYSDRYPDPYCTELRKKLEEKEGIERENILCGNGAAELIYSFAYSLSGSKPSLIPVPTFCEYETAMKAAGKPYTNDLKGSFSDYEAIYLCSPNNPTGELIPLSGIEQIAATGIRMLLDVTFLPFTENPFEYSLPTLLKKHPNIMALKAFTKDFAIPGIRLGYAMSYDKEFLRTMSEKTQCWNVSSLAQAAGVAAVECDSEVKTQLRAGLTERKRVAEELRKINNLTVREGAANFLLLYSEKDLYSRLYDRKILVRNCTNEKGLGPGYIRVSIKTDLENEVLIRTIREVLS